MWMRIFSIILSFIIVTTVYADDEAIPVTVQKLEKLFIYPQIEAPASVVSMNDSQISAEVSAKIIEIPVAVGDIVVKDTTLVQLDMADFELEHKRLKVKLARVAAQLNQAQTTLKQQKDLGRNTSKSKLKKAQTDVRILQLDYQEFSVAVNKAARNIEKCVIHSPFTGLVLERLGKVGEFVSPGKPIIRVMDVERIEVSAQVQSKDIESLEATDKLYLEYQEKRYPLKLRTVVSLLDSRTRTQEVRLTFLNEHALPGTSGRLIWNEIKPHFPPEILVRRKGKLGVMVYKNKRVKFVELTHALEGRPILATLPGATWVVINGRYSVKEGDTVKASKHHGK